MADTRIQEKFDKGLEAAIQRVVQTKEGIELVQALLELAKLGKLAKVAKGAGLWVTIGLYAIQFAAKDPQHAITAAELMTSNVLFGIPVDYALAVDVVQFLMDKRLVDKQQRPLPGITDAIAGTEC